MSDSANEYFYAINPIYSGVYGFPSVEERENWLGENPRAEAVERSSVHPDIRAEFEGR